MIEEAVARVCLDAKTVLCICEKCGQEFQPVRHQRFCSAACRQAAYRDSSKYQARLLELKNNTLARRNDRFRSLNRYRALEFDGRFAGPLYGGGKRVRLQKDRRDLIGGAPRCLMNKTEIKIFLAGRSGQES
jgi:hypothetical protein